MGRYHQLFTWIEPQAGNIAFVRYKSDENVEDFCLDLREKKGVFLLPSTTYDYGTSHFRIGFGRANFAEVLRLLEEYIKEENLTGY